MALTPTLRPRAGAAIVALLLAGVALTGCGSDDDGDAGEPTSGSPSASASETPGDTPSEPPSDPEAPGGSATPSETGEPTPSTTPVPEGTPACAEVWVDGASLPRTYAGCAEGETFVAPDRLGCSSGQRIVRYADRFYAVAGSDVTETSGPLAQDPDYGDAVARCRG
ncbi:hypothetical protein FE634_07430 [Nocardioides dongxiaopingii]|uniref:hypothetical protein n=1 Tax=Nocardioides sp. S-1144 TaxID=2582905 RepID=UPI00110F03FD|nr:hypothetical protein [Nocardioides sp. S-1144]QCW50274.1 hypothetical protein FE634_07430 [Nocardioides sp. S-1144]